jgi:hypothetical protein
MGELWFLQRFRSVLLESFEEARRIPIEDLNATVLEQLRKAERYGLVSEQQAATFVMTAWLLGSDFDMLFPAVRERLSDPRLSQRTKAKWLEAFAERLLSALEDSEN